MKALVVCPTYGRIPFLGRMLASFLSQNYVNKHLVIINDDKNITLKCDYQNVTCINLTQKMLLAHKRNLGSAFDYSDIIVPLDDDDIFLPERISNHVKFHKKNPSVGMYWNTKSYLTYGDMFKVDVCSPMASSYKRTEWFKQGGYTHTKTSGEDVDFIDKIVDKVIINDGPLDFVYNYGGINYHASGSDDKTIDQIAYQQLVDLGLVGKEYLITPDFEEFNKFLELVDIHKVTNTEIQFKHLGLAKIELI